MSDGEAIARWCLALTAIAVATLPTVVWLGQGLGGARFGLVRPVSLVLLTAVVWWPAAALGTPFSRLTLCVAVGVVALVGWYYWIRARFAGFDARALIAFEATWLLTFLAYAWFRSFAPDIANTEKPMDIAMLSATARSNDVPAPDPWLAGSPINYYYFGYQSFATAIKLSGVPPAIAFNLALASLFASCATAAAAGGAQLARFAVRDRRAPIAAGALAPVLLLLSGNLETARRLIASGREVVDADWWRGVGWQASRVIVDSGVHTAGDTRATINEFPAFSFVLGDLHPHVLTYPLLASVVVLALGLATRGSRTDAARLIVIGALTGLLYASNSWDAPAGMLIVCGALVLSSDFEWRRSLRLIAIVAVASAVAVAPFVLRFDPPVGVSNGGEGRLSFDLPILGTVGGAFGVVTWRPSNARELLIVHGAWIAVFAAFLVALVRRQPRLVDDLRRRRHLLLAAVLLALGVSIAWAPAALLLGAPFGAAVWLMVRAANRGAGVIAGLYAAGFLLVITPEFIFIQDVFADRMNTVFKLYFQAWLILAFASASALVVTARLTTARLRPVLIAGYAVMFAMTLSYTPLSAWDWSSGFTERHGLAGDAYIRRSSPGDMAAIEWIRRHASATDTIVEAPGCAYGSVSGAPMNRVSAFTGAPTMVGWLNHEGQWRRGQDPLIHERLNRIAEDANAVIDGIVPASRVEARFVVLGPQELIGSSVCDTIGDRGHDPVASLRAAGWTVAFEASGTRVFSRPDDPVLAGGR